ncbi:hypothetical protein ACFLYJ_03600 [Candidatus Cloacimonadota bacterium]
MKKTVYLFLLLVISYSCLFSTQVIRDYLIFEGKTYSLDPCPLEPFFEKYPEKRPDVDSIGFRRGYVATFEIRDSLLLVQNIQIPVWKNSKQKLTSITETIFSTNNDIIADMFNGLILIRKIGKSVSSTDSTLGWFQYEKYVIFQIEDGIVTKQCSFNDSEFQEFLTKQIEAFRKTPEYKSKKDEIMNRYVIINIDGPEPTEDEYLELSIFEYSKKILVEIK